MSSPKGSSDSLRAAIEDAKLHPLWKPQPIEFPIGRSLHFIGNGKC
jgi:hypothetical protein